MSKTEIILSVVSAYYAIGFGRVVYFATKHEYDKPKCLMDWCGAYLMWTTWPVTLLKEFKPK